MENDHKEFEKFLASIPPREPSASLKERICHTLADAEEEPAIPFPSERIAKPWLAGWKQLFVVSTGLAAAYALMFILDVSPFPQGNELPQSNPSQIVAPVEANAAARPVDRFVTVLGATPGEVYYLDEQPVQQVSIRYMDTEVWKLENSEQTFAMNRFREEIRVIPADPL